MSAYTTLFCLFSPKLYIIVFQVRILTADKEVVLYSFLSPEQKSNDLFSQCPCTTRATHSCHAQNLSKEKERANKCMNETSLLYTFISTCSLRKTCESWRWTPWAKRKLPQVLSVSTPFTYQKNTLCRSRFERHYGLFSTVLINILRVLVKTHTIINLRNSYHQVSQFIP